MKARKNTHKIQFVTCFSLVDKRKTNVNSHEIFILNLIFFFFIAHVCLESRLTSFEKYLTYSNNSEHKVDTIVHRLFGKLLEKYRKWNEKR